MVSCFDARAWLEAYSATAGFHRFSQGFQDSALVSLQERGLIGPSGTYVEFGFHLRDVQGTAARPSVRAGNAPRLHLRPREIPSFGSNTELLRRHFGWTGSRFDADEVNETLAPDLSLEWITPQTVVSIFRRHGVQPNVDYVSIDIDSCDLWVFLALTDVYRPRLITVECVPPPHGTAAQQTRSAPRC
jgi:hypothetical protein